MSEEISSLVAAWESMDWSIRKSNGESIFKRPVMDLIARLERRAIKAEREVNELNNILRAAGWGQGEIDSAAEMLYKLETENRELKHQLEAARDHLKQYAPRAEFPSIDQILETRTTPRG